MFVSYAVADIWMMIYVLSLRRVPCVEVLHILFMLVLSLFSLLCSGMQFWIPCTTEIGHYNVMKYGRFFAREYLYIG